MVPYAELYVGFLLAVQTLEVRIIQYRSRVI